MLKIYLYSLTSVFLISLVSFVGIFTLALGDKKLKKILLYLVGFSTGALFGGAFLHLLPEAVEKYGFTPLLSFYVILGILFSFVAEKFISWRHCHIPTSKEHPHPFAYMNLFGDGVHNFIDGLIIGAAFLTDISLGIATSVAIILHEIPQEIGDFGVLIHGGFSKKKALLFNFLTALTAVLGTFFALILGGYIDNLTLFLVPFAAGGFIYIAGSDLIPELHKEYSPKKSLIQFFSILAGVGVMALMLILE